MHVATGTGETLRYQPKRLPADFEPGRDDFLEAISPIEVSNASNTRARRIIEAR